MRHQVLGQPLLRREDQRLLSGGSAFIDDLTRPGMREVAFLRSPFAHARLVSLDLTRARALPGVTAVLGWSDLAGHVQPMPPSIDVKPPKWLAAVRPEIHAAGYTALVHDVARYAGEPVAVVVATDRYIAEDALDLIEAEWEPLLAVTDPEAALGPQSPLVHPAVPGNVLLQFQLTKGAPAEAMAAAPHRLKERFCHHRYCASPMECRGVVAFPDPLTGDLVVYSSTQSVFWLRNILANLLGLPEESVRCQAPDIGGSFGVKSIVYQEEVVVAHLALRLGASVKWSEDRREHLVAATHARDQVHDVEVGFDSAGRLLCLRDQFIRDSGAYNPWGIVDAYNTAAHLQGPYRIPHLEIRATCAATNKTPTAPYRGAGRPEAAFAIERTLDRIAAYLDLEPALVRERNLVRPEEMPYASGLLYRDGEPIVYDSGDYPEALRRALAAIDLPSFRTRQAEARARGELLGLGLACAVEGTGVGPHEGVSLRIGADGGLTVVTGAVPHGQSHHTTLAQVAAELWQVPMERVRVVTSDSAAIGFGAGTFASRTAVVVSSAIWHATRDLHEKCRTLAAHLLECSPADLEFRDGRLQVAGAPAFSLSLADLARAAQPGWGSLRPSGLPAGLEATHYYEPPTVTWAYAAHAAVVRVHPLTGRVAVLDYVVVHDSGRLINPQVVRGQICGGVAQGLGGALLEELVYDATGQLLTGTLMDYLLPTATDVPAVRVFHMETPSPLNPLGIKGLGEAGAIGPPAAIAGAVEDALRHLGAKVRSTPLSPARVLELMRSR